MRSLQGKIILVYLALAALALGLSLLALLELNRMANKVQATGQVAEFFDTTLELRRFEKNHFLYAQPEDLTENRRYTSQALNMLERDLATFADLIGESAVAALAGDLRRYSEHMTVLASRPDDEGLAADVRALGKAIVTAGEGLAQRKRHDLREALDAHQRNLLVSVAVVVALLALAGLLLARWVTRPLQAMEASMEAVARGSLARLEPDARERELASLGRAFNHVLDELERRQRTLVRSEKLASLGTLLSGVAHELNNPLSNISTSAQILTAEPEAEADADFRRELLADIDRESQRAARIVSSLLDYTRERGFRRRPVALPDLVDETLRFLKTRRGPGVTARIEIPADLKVAADRPRLQQALVNLIGNALDAMGEKGELSILARRGQARRAGLGGGDVFPPGTPVVDILIADTGPGIPAEVLPRIFDPFYTTKPVGQGSGLGLFIVHQVMEEHGGWIGAENLATGGARFHIRLPEGAAGAATSTAYKSKP